MFVAGRFPTLLTSPESKSSTYPKDSDAILIISEAVQNIDQSLNRKEEEADSRECLRSCFLLARPFQLLLDSSSNPK